MQYFQPANFIAHTGDITGADLDRVCDIRIFNGCEVRIKKSVTGVSIRHHKACRVIPNSYPE